MAESVAADKVGVGVLCALACVVAAGIYFFGFSNAPLTTESWFWAGPVLSPIAFVVYLKWRRLGAVVMLLLYAAAVTGTSRMFQNDCVRGGACFTQSRVAIVLSSTVAGYHMILMFVALVWMCSAVWKARKLA